MSPPEDELGVPVPVQQVLTAGDEAVVVLSSCVAYTSGFQLGIAIRKKHEPPPLSNPRLHREMPEMRLDVGVRFADGRRLHQLAMRSNVTRSLGPSPPARIRPCLPDQ